MAMHGISILGSTGSVGTSTLAVVDAYRDRLEVVAMSAGSNVALLAEQFRRYRPGLLSVRTAAEAARLAEILGAEAPEIMWGEEGNVAVAGHPDAETVVAAIVGAAGTPPVHAALLAGKRVAIANKEVLVAAGDVMEEAVRAHGGEILPIDSEHCAVHQALRCGTRDEVERIILTASGGPFLRRDVATFGDITIQDALAHPTWKMGNKITIDSATMMNKGLEVIEAHHLFDIPSDRIDILIHPQSIVHSMVEYVDGSIMAQLSTTDMKFPVQYAVLYPERVRAPFARLDLAAIRNLEFLEVDETRFPAVRLAYDACRAGGSAPAVLNAANEVAVEHFLAGAIPFVAIVDTVRRTIDRHARSVSPVKTLEDAVHWNEWGRNAAREIVVGLGTAAR
jgi:1-deoxy-D-xylulose-5-phosphate reductoisomerase